VNRRAVVTGLGVIAPNGFGVKEFWDATCLGKTGIGRISQFDPTKYPATLAGEISDFDASSHLPDRLVPQTDRMTQLALVAADHALADAKVEPAELPEFGMGVMTASSCGGFEFGERELRKLWSQGSQFVSAYQSFAWFYAVNTGQISIRHGMRGPSGVVVGDEAGGLDAIAQARRLVRKGVGLVVTGGIDASICSWGWVSRLASGQVSTSKDPERAYAPFGADACGHVPGEGGALLVVEDAETARVRGAPQEYGEIAGHGATFDPPPGSTRPPALRAAIEIALDDAGLAPEQIDVVFADGSGTPELDRVEAVALREVFGPCAVPVTVPKTMTGRLGSGSAPLDVATAFLAIRHGVIPPTANVTAAPDYELDLVTASPRQATIETALVLARGRGGFNSALVLRATHPFKERHTHGSNR